MTAYADRVSGTEDGQHRARAAVQPRPPACGFCGWAPDPAGRYLRLGDDREFHEVGGETICSACATGVDKARARTGR
jgi:hypothetical protein